jgi:hypothetical protein
MAIGDTILVGGTTTVGGTRTRAGVAVAGTDAPTGESLDPGSPGRGLPACAEDLAVADPTGELRKKERKLREEIESRRS